jgi:hypothetical protein
MLAVLNAHLLNFTSDKARIMLAVYTTPIVARMCGLPVEHLHIVHNGACTFTMFAIAVYVLLRGPNCIKWMKCSVMNVSADTCVCMIIVRSVFATSIYKWHCQRVVTSVAAIANRRTLGFILVCVVHVSAMA